MDNPSGRIVGHARGPVDVESVLASFPGDAPTAETGRWLPGPGIPFFAAVEQALGRLPIIAEDLGVITPDVVALRDHFGFPGMRVLQFAFDAFEAGLDNPHLPHNHLRNAVVYTGTHDNDTTAGWYAAASPQDQEYARAYVYSAGIDPASVAWDLVRVAQASVAHTAMVPLQDLLGLESAARMNLPGQLGGNWQWRFQAEALMDDLAARVARVARLYGRAPGRCRSARSGSGQAASAASGVIAGGVAGERPTRCRCPGRDMGRHRAQRGRR